MNNSNRNLTKIGTIQDVSGATLNVKLDDKSGNGLTFINGKGFRIGQVGSFVRIPMGFIDLFAVVTKIGASAIPEKLIGSMNISVRWMTIQLVGEGHPSSEFKRGVGELPTIGDEVHLITPEDLETIYRTPTEPNYVRIGTVANSETIPALIDVNKLVTRHSAVLGTTGSGKSTLVASIASNLSEEEQYKSSRVIILDLHGEYGNALREKARIFKINPNKQNNEFPLYIPYWALNYEEFIRLTMGTVEEISSRTLIERIMELKLESLKNFPISGFDSELLTVDTPIPFSIHKFWFELHKEILGTFSTSSKFDQDEDTAAYLLNDDGDPIEVGNALTVTPPKYRPHTPGGQDRVYLSASTLNIRRNIDALGSKLRDKRFDFMFRPGEWLPNEMGVPEKDLDELLNNWFGDSNVSILDLSGTPVSIITELVGILVRIIHDALFWSRNLSEGGRERPILFILEEAHLYLNPGSKNFASEAVKRLVKEGRKYGIGAMIVSQRPSEVDRTILSQCGTIFAMRTANGTDRNIIGNSITDNLEELVTLLPSLRTGETIVVGEAVRIPMRVIIDKPSPDKAPASFDPLVYDPEGPGGWNRELEEGKYSDVMHVWRSQNPESPNITKNGGEINYEENSC